jgi:hypothetical protein
MSANQFTYTTDLTPPSPATGTMFASYGTHFSEIVGNTATQITFRDSAQPQSGPGTLRFAVGDTFEINKVTQSMDMIGRGAGTINLNGQYSPSVPNGWNDQSTSAWYEWNNTREGGAGVHFSSNSATIVQGVHYFNDTTKPGYTPFAYPHPLVSGITGLAAPTNLRVTGP